MRLAALAVCASLIPGVVLADGCQPHATPRGVCRIDVIVGKASFFYLQPGEEVTAPLSVGDANATKTKNWVVESIQSGTGNEQIIALIIRAAEPGLETNMLVGTQEGYRLFDLRSVAAPKSEEKKHE
jgi:type IV secretory pathway VirB9-like protein